MSLSYIKLLFVHTWYPTILKVAIVPVMCIKRGTLYTEFIRWRNLVQYICKDVFIIVTHEKNRYLFIMYILYCLFMSSNTIHQIWVRCIACRLFGWIIIIIFRKWIFETISILKLKKLIIKHYIVKKNKSFR